MERATSRLMQLAKRQLMLKQAAAAANSDFTVRIMERSIAALDKLIRICSGGPKRSTLKFNHAQCRLLDLQGFQDNLQNLLDEIASLAAAEREKCASAAIEIWRVAINAEALVAEWMSGAAAASSESGENQWMIPAMAHACDGGMAAGQQNHEQQWCVAVMEVVLAQFRAARGVDSGRMNNKAPLFKREQHIPFWMVDRTFEIGEEYLGMDEDRGLAMAVRLDRRRLLDRLKRMMQRADGVFLRLLTSRRSARRQELLARYLACKLDCDEGSDSRIESYIEIFHQQQQQQPENVAVLGQKLGAGSYGTVYKSDWLGLPAAVKKITVVSSVDDFWNEIAVLADARHPRISQLLFASVDDETGDCCLWTELLGSDLESILGSDDGALELQAAVSIMLQVAEGMAYLHRKGVLHRSLKASNVLLVPAKKQVQIQIQNRRHILDEFARVRITDFGLPRTKEAATWQNPPGNIPRYWLAPEALDTASKFSKKSDVYAFGTLCCHILTRCRPFPEAMDDPDLIRIVRVEGARPSIPAAAAPPFLAALVQECWSGDAAARPTFDGICCFLRSFKALLIRCGQRSFVQDGDWKMLSSNLPLTPSDFANLRDRLGGLRFFVEAIALARRNQQKQQHDRETSLLDSDDPRDASPFPMDSFVLWLASCVDHLERDDGFATAAEIAGDFAANWTGSKHDFEQAVFWYHKAAAASAAAAAAAAGSDIFKPGSARWKLGICIEQGLGILKDEKRAVGLYKQAARQGFASAHVEIARCYQAGKGVEAANLDKAAAHFAKAQEIFDSSSCLMMEGIEFLMRILATALLDEDCIWAAERLLEISARSRIGRLILAGRDCCNVRELVGLLGDWKVGEIRRRRAKLLLERLGMEDDIFHQALVA